MHTQTHTVFHAQLSTNTHLCLEVAPLDGCTPMESISWQCLQQAAHNIKSPIAGERDGRQKTAFKNMSAKENKWGLSLAMHLYK